MNGRRFTALIVLAWCAGSVILFAQDVPLPEVRRQPSTATTVSQECSEPIIPDQRQPVTTSIAVAVPEPIEQPSRPVRPPIQPREAVIEEVQLSGSSQDLTAHELMAVLQRTARTGPYPEFTRTLELAQRQVPALPASNDKRALGEALDVYQDIDAVWNYAMTDPMGAFYNDKTLPGMFRRLAGKYPGYAEFISREAVTDSAGNQFYPTTETRIFLADEADRRLRSVRLRVPREAPPPVIAERPTRPQPQPEVRREPSRPPTGVTTRPPVPRRAEVRPPTPGRPEVRPPVRRRAVPSRPPTPAPTRRVPAEEPTATAPSATVPPVTARPVPAEPVPTPVPEEPAIVEPSPTVATTPTATMVPPPIRRQPAPAREAEGPSSNLLLLVAFALIALIAVALIFRALRSRQTAPALITSPPAEPLPETQPAKSDADWIDPETRHWIEDANKPEKPPN